MAAAGVALASTRALSRYAVIPVEKKFTKTSMPRLKSAPPLATLWFYHETKWVEIAEVKSLTCNVQIKTAVEGGRQRYAADELFFLVHLTANGDLRILESRNAL